MEKTLVVISEIKAINDHQVMVKVFGTGREVLLPRSQIEVFGPRVFIPSWLARKEKIKDKI